MSHLAGCCPAFIVCSRESVAWANMVQRVFGCSTNARRRPGKTESCGMTYLDVWRSGTFPEKQRVSECATDCKYGP